MDPIRCCGSFARKLGQVGGSIYFRCKSCGIVYDRNEKTKRTRKIKPGGC